MEEILKANIFFFITSVSVVLVTIMVLLVLYYVYRTVKNVKELSDSVKTNTEEFMRNAADDSTMLRRNLKRYGGRVARILAFTLGTYVKDKVVEKKRNKRHRREKEDDNREE